MKLKEARSIQRLHIFKSDEMDFQFLRALAWISERGAEFGECLSAASRIKNDDPNSWSDAFCQLAEDVSILGQDALSNNNLVNARDCFLRSTNYFRAAEYFISPKETRFQEMWEKSRIAFQAACRLMDCQATAILIPFENKEMPGYFFRPYTSQNLRPTLIIHGGTDSSGEELYFFVAADAVRHGYNAVVFEGPGHRGCVHLNSTLIERPDFEAPTKSVIDFVIQDPDVDPERLALIGFSFGGYRCARAVAFEHRIRAVVLDAPIRDHYRFVNALFGGLLSRIPSSWLDRIVNLKVRQSSMFRVFIEYVLWKQGFEKVSELVEDEKNYTLEGLESQITCPVLALVGEGEGKESLAQARKFIENISSTEKTLHLFTIQEGGDAHCQINNNTLRNQVTFDWLNRVLRIP